MPVQTTYVEISQQAIAAADAALNAPGQAGNAGKPPSTTGITRYMEQATHADGTPVYGNHQARPRK
ncbi:unnamed protein product [Tuber melanosporum]|uniref:(Perigord truffle) hypothetical protein n=1 Tax=Tuber melanosporum (strain Mel28) TaxID=656061 RepID=D5GAP9_TUBMM|nr:uncharacterized protein GSTUM_00003724001 [Tuber melanosporum]CAZ81592.1 unnamed protein product [Tuber melanosporum]